MRVAVHGLNYIIKKICHDDRVLIVDDVFDTGNTIVAVIEELKIARAGQHAGGHSGRGAVSINQPAMKLMLSLTTTSTKQSEWLVFPHELDALEPEELRVAPAANRRNHRNREEQLIDAAYLRLLCIQPRCASRLRRWLPGRSPAELVERKL